MIMANHLNNKGFHCKENPDHKDEMHKLIRNTWICCDDVNVVPENEDVETLVMPPKIKWVWLV